MYTDYPKPNADRARIAILFIYCTIPFHFLNTLLPAILLFGGAIPGRNVTVLGPVFIGISVLQIAFYIISAVFFIMWFRRAYNNLHIAGSKYLSYDEGWAAGAWFVPLLNLFLPYKIMMEIWNEMQLCFRVKETKSTIKDGTKVGVWWALFLVGNITSALPIRFGGNIFNGFVSLILTSLIKDTIFLVDALLLVSIIRQVAVWEEEMREGFHTWQMLYQQQQYVQQQQNQYMQGRS